MRNGFGVAVATYWGRVRVKMLNGPGWSSWSTHGWGTAYDVSDRTAYGKRDVSEGIPRVVQTVEVERLNVHTDVTSFRGIVTFTPVFSMGSLMS